MFNLTVLQVRYQKPFLTSVLQSSQMTLTCIQVSLHRCSDSASHFHQLADLYTSLITLSLFQLFSPNYRMLEWDGKPHWSYLLRISCGLHKNSCNVHAMLHYSYVTHACSFYLFQILNIYTLIMLSFLHEIDFILSVNIGNGHVINWFFLYWLLSTIIFYCHLEKANFVW